MLVERAWPYAQIAYNSYHREVASAAAQPFQLPVRFQRLPGGKPENDDIGLAFDILAEDVDENSFNLIFAFRGTEGPVDLLGAAECDWKFGDHRLHQQERAVGMVAQYLSDPAHHLHASRRLRDIILIGHSLGGGIALHTSYRVPGSWVYVFNSSPRFLRPRPYRLTATDTEWRRLSIAQRGEVVKAARLPAREATQLYLPVSCTSGGPFERHSMLALAVCLTKLAVAQGVGPSAREAAQSMLTQPEQYKAERLKNDVERAVPKCRD